MKLKLPLIFSTFTVVLNGICLVVSMPSPASDSKEITLPATHLPQQSQFQGNSAHFEGKVVKWESGKIGNVNKTEIGVIDKVSEKTNKNNDNGSIASENEKTSFEAVPETISTTTVPSLVRKRAAKVLEKPLDLQFHELPVEENYVMNQDSPQYVNFSTTTKPLSSFPVKERRLAPVRKQDMLPPASGITFPFFVSPLEGSLGGLTGLQGLPPLNPVQFVKMLVALTPFIIPIIFIPLLIFTIGLLMIPVTKANVFVGGADLRSIATSSIPSLISSYIVTPIKAMSDMGSSGITAISRAYAYDLVDTEECVERISCEIASRYLDSHWQSGNWRSVANTSWISRIINYWWSGSDTVSRVAKSLRQLSEDSEELKNRRVPVEEVYEERGTGTLKTPGQCAVYTCSPKTLVKKFLSSNSSSRLKTEANAANESI